MTARSVLLGGTVALFAVAGCNSDEGVASTAATTPAPSESHAVQPPVGDPAAAAQTPCGDAVRGELQAVLGLDAVPPPQPASAGSRHTCTYQTPEGPVIFAVDVETTAAAAAESLEALREELHARTPLTDLEEAYENGLGAVVARYDVLVLTVDASELPLEHNGPNHTSQTGVAVVLATGVVDGWASST
jgi:hypothetical protein